MPRRLLFSLSIFVFLITTTIISFFLARGYRIDIYKKEIAGTGIILATSTPDGALVYLNNIATSATNTALTNLRPGTYTIRMEKQGYSSWEKKITVEKEFVTKVDALLVPLFPKIDPLTSGNAQKTLLSPDGQNVIFKSTQSGQDGIWLLELTTRPFNLGLRPRLILADVQGKPYSKGNITWSPDSKSLLIELTDHNIFTLFDVESKALTEIDNSQDVLQEWESFSKNQIKALTENLDQETQNKIASIEKPVWSPDNSKILYQLETAKEVKFMVFDLKPDDLGLKESEEFSVYVAPKEQFTKLVWYPDSNHLFILIKEKLESAEGTIKVVEKDGENENQIFSGTIVLDYIFPYPNGSKIAILTTFTPESNQHNLYSINLR